MGLFKTTHEINCNAEAFWKTFVDQTFTKELYEGCLGCQEFTISEQRETNDEVFRQWTFRPKWAMPGPVAKLLGDGFRFKAEGTLDKKTGVWRVKYAPSTLADKIRYGATIRVEPLRDDKVRRIADFEIEAKIFGIGGLVESSLEKYIREECDKSSMFMNKWIADHKA